MKKILFIIPTLTQTNGVAAFMINYFAEMDLNKIKVEVIYNNLRPSQQYIDFFKQKKIKTYKLPYIRNVGLKKYCECIDDFFEKHHDYDLIYSNVSYQTYFFHKYSKKYHLINYAIHSHATSSSDNFFKNIIGKFLQLRVNGFSKNKFACSKLAGEAMFKKKPFTIINNAIDYSKYAFNEKYRNKIRKELKINDDIKIIGFVGRFVPQKNIFFFIKLAEKLTDQYKILMIGQGVQKQDFISKIKELKIENKFILIDEITNVNEYYSAFDYFFLPSIYEGLPVVGVEAQANGLPCLFSNTISDECKISNNSFFLDKSNVDEWIYTIEKCKRSNRLNLNDSFNIHIQAKKFEDILTKL